MNVTPQKTSISASQIIEAVYRAKDAEISQDLELQAKLLQIFWYDLDALPEFSADMTREETALIYRVCGFFLARLGRVEKNNEYIERGKQYLTKAVTLFEKELLFKERADALNALALSYFHSGDLDNSEVFWFDASELFEENKSDPLYLKIQINLVILYIRQSDRLKQAFDVIKRIEQDVAACNDDFVKAMFHNHTAVLLRTLNYPADEIIHHYEQSFCHAGKIDNRHFQCAALNNVACLFAKTGNYREALANADKALKIANSLGHTDFIGNIYDTKAEILMKQRKFDEAQLAANCSIEILSSLDTAALANSYFTKVKIYVSAGRTTDALLTLSKIAGECSSYIGEKRVRQYFEQFAEFCHLVGDKGFDLEKHRFERKMIESAFSKNKSLESAATSLKLATDDLANILLYRFDDIAESVGLRELPKPRSIESVDEIGIVETDAGIFIGGIEDISCNIYVFYLPAALSPFGGDKNLLVAVKPDTEGEFQIIWFENKFYCGELFFDQFANLWTLNADFDLTFTRDSFACVGSIVGIADASELYDDFLHFDPV